MSVQVLTAEPFLALAATHPVIDVRSPGEFAVAHIPGAYSLPLFNDEERATIGTAYKQISREAAIKIGLDAFGPKMRRMTEAAERIYQEHYSPGSYAKSLLVHCWRGGMRSAAVCWLLDLYGFKVYMLEGGYKAYRQWVIAHWDDAGPVCVLGGSTGSGKTKVLAALKKLGQPVLDLEALAQHKGSAFGDLDNKGQPSQAMFENLLAADLHHLRNNFPGRAIWLEDESQRIGNVNIPGTLFRQWAGTGVSAVGLKVPFDQRLSAVVEEYGGHSTESIINAIVRIKKRLGPLETKTAIAHLVEGDLRSAFSILLHYYDKHYAKRAAQRSFQAVDMSPGDIALTIQHYTNETTI